MSRQIFEKSVFTPKTSENTWKCHFNEFLITKSTVETVTVNKTDYLNADFTVTIAADLYFSFFVHKQTQEMEIYSTVTIAAFFVSCVTWR